MRLRLAAGALAAAVVVILSHPVVASADGGLSNSGGNVTVEKDGQMDRPGLGGGGPVKGGEGDVVNDVSKPPTGPDPDLLAYTKWLFGQQGELSDAYVACVARGATDCRYTAPAAPTEPADTPDDAPAIPAQTIAYAAIARLHLDAPTPRVDPDPDLNRWKLAVVGYPLWLSAGGDHGPLVSSARVFDATVSLRASLVDVTFAMGNGDKVTCADSSRQWSPAVAVGSKSPTCGYTYVDPAPDGTYPVTGYAHWDVAWTVNGVSGVLPVYRQASIDLPVGELQVLVR